MQNKRKVCFHYLVAISKLFFISDVVRNSAFCNFGKGFVNNYELLNT